MMKMLTTMMLMMMLLINFAQVKGESVSVTHKYQGGFPFCSQCGLQGEYACSPDANGTPLGQWNNGVINFKNPVPSGNHVTGLSITLTGSYACNAVGNRAMFGVALNGMVHAVRESTKGGSCKCDTCDGTETISFTHRNELSFYKYGDNMNSFQLLPYKDSVCLNQVNITITYMPSSPSSPLPEYYLPMPIDPSFDRVGCPVCNSNQNQWCSASNQNTLTLNFTDPLPQNAFNYVVAVDVFLSYNMIQKSITYLSSLAVLLQGESVGSKSLSDSAWRSQCGCLGELQYNSDTYQRGWPAYKQQGVNELTLRLNKYSQSYGNVCVGRLAMKLIYYQSGDETLREHIFDL